MPPPRSLYDILNVAPAAEPAVIEAAYRALMKKYHPDQASEPPVGTSSAADINEAFSVLRDPARRAKYDHEEFNRRTSLDLVRMPPPPVRRGIGAAGWSGWFVALLLCCVIATMVRSRQPALPTIAEAEATEPKALAGQSQPVALPAARTAMAAPVEVEAEPPPVSDVDRALHPLFNPQTKPVADDPAPEQVVRQQRPPKARRTPPRRPKAKTRKEDDFLERQGYIY